MKLLKSTNSKENSVRIETFEVRGMRCSSCSFFIKKTIKQIDGVKSVEVNYGTEKAKITYDPAKTNPNDLSKAIKPFGYSLKIFPPKDYLNSKSNRKTNFEIDQLKKDKLAELDDMRMKLFSAIPSGPSALLSFASSIFRLT